MNTICNVMMFTPDVDKPSCSKEKQLEREHDLHILFGVKVPSPTSGQRYCPSSDYLRQLEA